MHKLNRPGTPPPCLSSYCYPGNTWDEVTIRDKQQIRASLQIMQDTRCAYCECPVYADSHIEHFRRKNPLHYPQLTFAWDNLFLSCDSQEHCGHYKDRPGAPAYNASNLIKPDTDDPDTYFYFHSSGEIRIRSVAGAPNLPRAEETIRVFNLNCGQLKGERRRALRHYEKLQPNILETLMEFDTQTRQEFIDQEIAATRMDPHWTVIRHYFQKAH